MRFIILWWSRTRWHRYKKLLPEMWLVSSLTTVSHWVPLFPSGKHIFGIRPGFHRIPHPSLWHHGGLCRNIRTCSCNSSGQTFMFIHYRKPSILFFYFFWYTFSSPGPGNLCFGQQSGINHADEQWWNKDRRKSESVSCNKQYMLPFLCLYWAIVI